MREAIPNKGQMRRHICFTCLFGALEEMSPEDRKEHLRQLQVCRPVVLSTSAGTPWRQRLRKWLGLSS